MKEKNAPYVTSLDLSLADKLRNTLEERGLTFTKPDYTLFQARKAGLSCTLYRSGKLVVQGREMADFVQFYLEPELLGRIEYATEPVHAHSGADEAGKGDFFGPLCVATLFSEGERIEELKALGVRDSKGLSDKKIAEIAARLRRQFVYYILKVTPAKYNELYAKFGNLNRLLAWCHATAIERIVEKCGCREVIIDKFGPDSRMQWELDRRELEINLVQRVRGEEDLVVAGASILARNAFVEELAKLEKQFDCKLPKGASAQVVAAGKAFVKRHGRACLGEVAKMHFKTLDAIERLSP